MNRRHAASLLGFVLLLGAAVVVAGEKGAEPAAKRADVLYSCACGPECPCVSASLKAGQCKCGKPLAWGHVLKVAGTDAYVCTCKEGCTCKLDPKSPTKCGCGGELKEVSLKGSGIYT